MRRLHPLAIGMMLIHEQRPMRIERRFAAPHLTQATTHTRQSHTAAKARRYNEDQRGLQANAQTNARSSLKTNGPARTGAGPTRRARGVTALPHIGWRGAAMRAGQALCRAAQAHSHSGTAHLPIA